MTPSDSALFTTERFALNPDSASSHLLAKLSRNQEIVKRNDKSFFLNADEENEFLQKRSERYKPFPSEWDTEKRNRYKKWHRHLFYLSKKEVPFVPLRNLC